MSEEALQRVTQAQDVKISIAQRGFDLILGNYPAIDNIITSRKWENFYEPPK